MRWQRNRSAFTLVELLVVIGIIVVLVSILFPVFSIVKQRAQRTKCISQMHMLITALKQYQTDHRGRYPGPVYFDAVDGIYRGGAADLVNDYIDGTSGLICPADFGIRRASAAAATVRYSSYMGKATDPGAGNWTLTDVYYNYWGLDDHGLAVSEAEGSAGGSWYTTMAGPTGDLATRGLRLSDLPRLANRNAPGYTIAFHCPYHWQSSTGDEMKDQEIIARLDGSVDVIVRKRFEADGDQPPQVGTGKAPAWMSQYE